MIRATSLSAALVLLASSAHADTLAGRASIIDADTIEIHGERVRILDIDAPESRQACFKPDGSAWRCGQQAALALADWIGAAAVTCETTRKDKYKRWLARCDVGGVDVAEWLAGQGWGVPYRGCACEGVRAAAEIARLNKRGIWASDFELPWGWRKH
jgi:endonuclease YncB( thermonuclease family)